MALGEAEEAFRSLGNRGGMLRVARERLLRLDAGTGTISVRDAVLAALQTEAQTHGDAPLVLAILGDRIGLLANASSGDAPPDIAVLERLVSQYDAARLEQESTALDITVYGQIARIRAVSGDDGGAAIAYERALSAVRRVFVALTPFPEAKSRFAVRQNPLVTAARECCRRLGHDADAERYARLLA